MTTIHATEDLRGTRRYCYGLLAAGLLLGSSPAVARTSNGNDFALFYSEAKTEREKKELLDEARGRPHFFRYLQIMEMEDRSATREGVKITAFEPASYMDVLFLVKKRVSLSKLQEEPLSKVGDALAITGIITGVVRNTIVLGPVIVRHKDRLSPKRGKEMLYEVDPGATFYSYTGGKRAVSLTYKDRDLLQHRDKILAGQGKQGWTEFLERELAKREKARAAARKARTAERKARAATEKEEGSAP